MKPGGGSKKGGAFEREMAKVLSVWVTDGAHDDALWRTAGSGSRGTLKGAQNQLGDLNATDAAARDLTAAFILECKCYRKVMWSQFLFDARGDLARFWIKLRLDCKKNGERLPLLLVKENFRPTLVVTDAAVVAAQLGQPLLISEYHEIAVYYLGEFLATPYSQFNTTIKRLRHAVTAYHRPAPYRAPTARIPLAIRRVAGATG